MSQMNLRIDPARKNLIDHAAALQGKTRTDFMIEASYQAAEEVILDQRLFVLNDEQWTKFNQALDKAPSDNKKLRKLLNTAAPWEK